MQQSTRFARLTGPQRLVFISICVWFIFLAITVNGLLAHLQAKSDRRLPFGISSSHGEIFAQDFSYNILFLQGVRERLVAHPYRLEDQEKMMRQILPGITTGMSHAYSPVAFVLALPLLSLPGDYIFLIYTTVSALGIMLLFYFCLLPRAVHPMQLLALTICAVSVWLATSFAVGQSTLLTTSLLGGFWFLLQRRAAAPPLIADVVLAAFFWALCLKPSVAILPAMLLLGFQAWRVFALGLGLLLATWIFVSGYYGGWWTGLGDYLHLLNHYHNADFTPFMQRFDESAAEKQLTALWFSLDRNLLLIVSLALLVLRWTNRITASEQFQGMIWLFLLLSPYLLPTENWVLCLLVVEGAFFQSTPRVLVYAKLLLLMGIVDLRMCVTSPIQVERPLKWLLFLWILAEWFLSRKARAANDDDPPARPSGAIVEG